MTDALVGKHHLTEFVHATPASHPTGRDNHAQVSRVQLHSLLHEQVIDCRIVGPTSAASHLIRWISNNDIELHVVSKQLENASFDVVGVDEWIGVSLQPVLAVEDRFRRAAESTFY